MSSTNYSSPKQDKSVSFKRISTLNNSKYRIELNPVEVVHENFELRGRLKELNLKLNELLETRPEKLKKEGKMSSPKSILVIAEKQLKHYETEYEMLKKRVGTLSEPGFINQLQQEVVRLNEEIIKLTTQNQLFKIREKKINREMIKTKDLEENKSLNGTDLHSLLNKKVQLEGMVERKEKKLKEIELKIQLLVTKSEHTETELKNYLEKGPIISNNSLIIKYKSLENILIKSQRGLNQIQRSYKSKLENLSNELKKIQSTQSILNKKFENSYKSLQRVQGTHSSLSKKFESSFKSPRNQYNLLRSLKSL